MSPLAGGATDALPLTGIRVLDVAHILAGPVSATLLADFGADVVKIEDPRGGDFTRRRGATHDGRSAGWLQEGRNKKSVTLDLRRARGRQLLRQLIPHFDVVVMSFRPPTLERWQLLPNDVQELHPRGILLYVTGYGLTGPYQTRGSFDRIASAFSGLTYVSGEPGEPPVRSGYAVVDYMTAYMAAFGVILALYERDLNGSPGQVIDLALYEPAFRACEDSLLAYAMTGDVRERSGNTNPSVVPSRDFTTSDGARLTLHAGTDSLFEKLAHAMGTPHLAEDPRFRTIRQRIENQDALYGIVEDWVSQHDESTVVELLSQADVPHSPLMSIADIANDRHYRERGTISTVDDPQFGRLPVTAPLPRFSRTPGRVRWLGPRLGADTNDVLENDLGLSHAELEGLRADGIV